MASEGGYLISQINNLTNRKINSILKKYGDSAFNGAQGKILYVLWNEDNIKMIDLSKRTKLAKTTLTSMVDRLVEQGLLEKSFDSEDKRIIRVKLTKKSNDMRKIYEDVTNKMYEIYYHDFSQDEINSFENCLRKIVNNLESDKDDKRN